MWPVPYTGLKVVHDQKINEALEHSRFSAEQATQKRSLRQSFSALLSHFTNTTAQKSEAAQPDCDVEGEGTFC